MIVRQPGGRYLAAVCIALSAVVWRNCLASPPDDASRWDPGAAAGTPSKLDYLVLASIADSPRLLALAGYRSSVEALDAAVLEDEAALESIRAQYPGMIDPKF